MKRWLWTSIFGLVVVGGVAAAVRLSRQKRPEGEVVAVKRETVQSSVQEVGSVEPFRKVDIKSKVAGQVTAVLVDVGDELKEGQVIMRLDPLDAGRDLTQVEARQKMTRAQLQQARAQLDFKKKAHASGALSDLELALADGEVKKLDAQVELNDAELAASRDRVAYTQLRSPIAGVVLARNVQPGELVTPGVSSMVDGKPLLIVAQIDQLLVRTELNQIDVARLKVGHKVDVTVDALPGQKFSGEVFRVAAMAQQSERRKESNLLIFPVDVIVSRAQGGAELLRPGMMADLAIQLDAHPNVLSVPLEAVVRTGPKAKVFRVVDDQGDDQEAEVVIGLQNDHQAEILSGLAEGDRVRIRPPIPTEKAAQSN